MHSILYGYLRYSIRKYNPKSLPRTKHLYTESCRLFFTALGILTINLLYSQDPDLIRSMHITGNNRTRTTYLNRFNTLRALLEVFREIENHVTKRGASHIRRFLDYAWMEHLHIRGRVSDNALDT